MGGGTGNGDGGGGSESDRICNLLEVEKKKGRIHDREQLYMSAGAYSMQYDSTNTQNMIHREGTSR